MNNVQGRDYPYLYCVVLGKDGFRLSRPRGRRQLPDGRRIVFETGRGDGAVYLVVRQHADRQGGWHTEDAAIAGDVVRRLARREPGKREEAAAAAVRDWAELGTVLPRPGVLALLAERVKGVRRSLPRHGKESEREPLPVEEARGADILEVCGRLGVELKNVGSSYRGPCPIHHSTSESHVVFSVTPSRNIFQCFKCQAGGDTIALAAYLFSIPADQRVRAAVELCKQLEIEIPRKP